MTSPRHYRLPLFIALALLLVTLLVIALRISHNQSRIMPPRTTSQAAADVRVIEVLPGRYQTRVTAYGSAQARYQLDLASQVNGQVTSLTPEFESGHQVAAGTLLATLEDSSYRAALASAKNNLATARLALLEEERAVQQAELEWQASGMEGKPGSDLVLRQPQLAAAKAAVNEAEEAVASARRDLENTQIRAPFNALVVSRFISPGSYLQSGSTVATLYSIDQLEIALPLSAADWQQLGELSTDTPLSPVTLTHVETGQQWQGTLTRSEHHLDSESRQRTAIVTVESPLELSTPLLPGTFVEANLTGHWVDNLWRLPLSALSQRGEIWYVAANQTLQKLATTPLFSDDEAIYISAPTDLADDTQQVVVQPLSSYLTGMSVTPQLSQDSLEQVASRKAALPIAYPLKEADNVPTRHF